MPRSARTLVLPLFLLTAPLPVSAQLEVGGSLLDACERIEDLVEDENYSEARGAARDCLEGLEQQLEGQIKTLFPQDVAGWQQTDFEQSKAMGFSSTSAEYRKGDVRVEIQLTGGSSLNALGGLAAMSMMQAGKQVKVAGLPAVIDNSGKILVRLEAGSLLNFSSRAFQDADAALAGMGDLVDAFPVAELNEALKAQED